MLQVAIEVRGVFDVSFFSEFGLRAKIETENGFVSFLNIDNLDGKDLFGFPIASNMLTADLHTGTGDTSEGQSGIAAMLVLAKRYKGQIILGDGFVSPSQAWAGMVKKSQEIPGVRALLEKHGVLPVDVLARLKPGAAVF